MRASTILVGLAVLAAVTATAAPGFAAQTAGASRHLASHAAVVRPLRPRHQPLMERASGTGPIGPVISERDLVSAVRGPIL